MIRHPSSRSSRMGILAFSSREPMADAFALRLDDDWHWFRQVSPGGIQAVDVVLVGPGGTWAITLPGDVSGVLAPPAEMAVQVEPGDSIGLIVEPEPGRLSGRMTAEPILSQQQ